MKIDTNHFLFDLWFSSISDISWLINIDLNQLQSILLIIKFHSWGTLGFTDLHEDLIFQWR